MKPLSFILALSSASSLLLTAEDDFGNATPIQFNAADLTAVVTGTNLGASAEVNEPAHAGIPASRSIWYALTVDEPRRVEIAGAPGTPTPIPNIVMSVYTGSRLTDLRVVSRYAYFTHPASSRSRHPGGEPFTQDARLAFDAEPGTTYFIAVDGESNAQGSFELTFSTSRDTLTPEFELVPAEASWSYYQALDLTVPTAPATFNPATADPDFYTTWHTAAAYNGPTFNGPVAAPFGYGAINGEPFRSFSLITPATDQRAAVTYFRTTFTPERGVQELGFEGMIDDGAVIYINGTEATRINMPAIANVTSTTSALAATFTPPVPAVSNEDGIQYATAGGLNLLAGEEVEIGVSLHNAGTTSSDLSFHMRVYATKADPIPAVITLAATQFKNTYRLAWSARKGFSYRVEFTNTNLDANSWQEEIQGMDTPEKDGPLDRFVLSTGPKAFWRVITTHAEQEE
jgi:hypothetical protein